MSKMKDLMIEIEDNARNYIEEQVTEWLDCNGEMYVGDEDCESIYCKSDDIISIVDEIMFQVDINTIYDKGYYVVAFDDYDSCVFTSYIIHDYEEDEIFEIFENENLDPLEKFYIIQVKLHNEG